VELGKKMAESLAPAVEKPDQAPQVDQSLKGILEKVAKWRG
jgi:hypothetical protein